MDRKIRNLIDFSQELFHKGNVKELYQKYLEDIRSITPQEVMLVQYEQLKMGLSPMQVLEFVDKLINVIHQPLSKYEWKRPDKGTFLYYLMEENRELVARLDAFKAVIKQKSLSQNTDKVGEFVRQVMGYEDHLLKLENILFPYLEKRMERYQGLKILWSLHEKVRRQWKDLIRMLGGEDGGKRDRRSGKESVDNRNRHDSQDRPENRNDRTCTKGEAEPDNGVLPDEQTLNEEIGQLYFHLYGLVQKQELILFPCATEVLFEEDFAEMHRQSFDYSFPFIERPPMPKIPSGAGTFGNFAVIGSSTRPGVADMPDPTKTPDPSDTADTPNAVDPSHMPNPPKVSAAMMTFFVTDTGRLDFEQLGLLLNALPVDLTFVDEHDKVAYFSKTKDRVFPRSAAVIGRDVRNCHPPESVHVVEAILDSFKSGARNEAEFWIQMKGKYIFIRYVALRDTKGNYRGTLEITQEISALRALEGQKRLLDW